MPHRGSRLRDRSTGDLLVLGIASTVCFVVLGGAISIMLIEILHPESDTDAAVGSINDIVNTLIGLLAGFLAGRTDANAQERLERERRERDETRPL